MTEKLQGCPFCGAEAIMNQISTNNFSVHCGSVIKDRHSKCPARMNLVTLRTKEAAAESWNTRAYQSRPQDGEAPFPDIRYGVEVTLNEHEQDYINRQFSDLKDRANEGAFMISSILLNGVLTPKWKATLQESLQKIEGDKPASRPHEDCGELVRGANEPQPLENDFADTYHDFKYTEDAWESKIYSIDESFEYESYHCDNYDGSVEFHGVKNEARLSAELQKFLWESGFIKCYVNHKDKWQAHYSLDKDKVSEGWRKHQYNLPYGTRSQISSVIWVEKFPEGWPKEWLESGYVRVIDIEEALNIKPQTKE